MVRPGPSVTDDAALLGYRLPCWRKHRGFVPKLSAVSVMFMSQHYSAPQTVHRGWQIFNYTAMALALTALICLIVVLIGKWAGASPWPGFNWIAMLALPAAFLMMGASVLRSVTIRRRF